MVFPRPASRGTELIPRPKPQFGDPWGPLHHRRSPFSRVFIQPAGHHHRVRAKARFTDCCFGDQEGGEVVTTLWSAIVLVLAAVVTAVWIGMLGFGLMRLIEYAI
jgi:hypothetical protein